MNRNQFLIAMAVMGVMSMAGSFLAVYVLQSEKPLNAQEGEAAGVVKATAFELVDKDGKSRASLSIGDDNGVQLTMLDDKGNGRLQLNSGGERAYLALLDRKGNMRYLVGQDDTSTMQTFNDAKGKSRILQQFQDDGNVLFSFVKEDGEASMTLLAGKEQASTLILSDPTGKNTVTMFAKDDQSSLQLEAGGGNLLNAVLGDGRPIFALTKDKHLRLRGMLGDDGTPEFIFLNDKKEAIWRANKDAK
ncbi:MAG: hypothetical protein KDB90_06785 [Planctomycetes bacterium]|nr:hypothetical protein [Planctomycetota bacterium]